MEKTLGGRYQVVRHLGGGGFGQTFLAKDFQLPGNPFCVVKQLKPKVSEPAALEIAKRLFDREAEILYRLGDCEQIPRLLAHFEEDEEFYLVQEFIEGQPLDRELAERRHLSEAALMELLRDILRGLAFVHQNNVIHRDIKPANLIRRSRDGKIVLIDFGAVKEVREVSAGGDRSLTVAVGSPGYMPVEQQFFKPQFSSDIYAVGMVCLEALTGVSPRNMIPDSSTGELTCALFQDSTPVSPGLAAIIDKMVRSDCCQRYQNAAVALEALSQLVNLGERDIYEASTILAPTQPSQPGTLNQRELQPVLGVRNQDAETVEARLAPPASDTSAATAPAIPSLTREEYRNRQILLNKVKNAWVKGVLEKSLHGQVLIVLGLEERLNAVRNPCCLAWETPDQPQQILPAGTRVIDQFDGLGMGRTLLILGEPGSGKTITLLELARDLLSRAEGDVSLPVPVVLNLSSWKGGKQTIAGWLVEELNSQYQVSKEIGAAWVKAEQLLLLLDGLDEVRGEFRDGCVQALNQFRQECGQTEMVVCVRIKDYEDLQHRLRLGAAIYLQPLADEQIQHYLVSAGAELRAVGAALQTDAQLLQLAKSPLMLNIIAVAYHGMSVEDLPSMNLEERRKHLFDAYIERMFSRRGAGERYPKDKATRWLIWLAQRMVQESQTVFLIERMQPSWLGARRQKWMYAGGSGLIFGLMVGLAGALIFGRPGGLAGGQIVGLIAGVSIALITGIIVMLLSGLISHQITPAETLKWSWEKAKKKLILGLVAGPFFGLLSGVAVGLLRSQFVGLFEGLIAPGSGLLTGGLILGLIVGLSSGLMFGLIGGGIETRTVPNQGIWQSVKNAIVFALIGVFGLGLGAIIMGIPIFWGALPGLFFGLIGGGEACIQHFTLRAVLYFSGNIPWNCARFLNSATERIFLQKVGGGYIFIHRLLLEHFAQMSLK